MRPRVNQGSGASTAVALSADGATVAFVSAAPELVPAGTAGDADPVAAVFVRDLVAGTVRQVLGSASAANDVAISADGRRVAFVRAVDGRTQVHVADLATGTTAGVSSATDAAEPALAGDAGWSPSPAGAAASGWCSSALSDCDPPPRAQDKGRL